MTKREAILEAAEELFADNGFDATSIRELAGRAGVNLAMINYYFGSKEKLFEALVEYRASYLRERIHDLQKEELHPVEKIERLIELYVERIFTHHRFHRILQRQISLQKRCDLNSAIMPIILKNAESVRAIVSEGVEKKVFRSVDSELFIVSIIGTISQVILSTTFCSRLLIGNSEGGEGNFYNEQLKLRVQNYLKDMAKHYLLA
jgi:AcrR family transcriptional regulator